MLGCALYKLCYYTCRYIQIPIACIKKLQTHWTLLLLSRQAPHTMPSMSSTPVTPATKPPRRRPTAVALLQSLHTGWTVSASTAVMLESLLTAGLLQSHSDSTPGRMADTMYTGLRCHYCCICSI